MSPALTPAIAREGTGHLPPLSAVLRNRAGQGPTLRPLTER